MNYSIECIAFPYIHTDFKHTWGKWKEPHIVHTQRINLLTEIRLRFSDDERCKFDWPIFECSFFFSSLLCLDFSWTKVKMFGIGSSIVIAMLWLNLHIAVSAHYDRVPHVPQYDIPAEVINQDDIYSEMVSAAAIVLNTRAPSCKHACKSHAACRKHTTYM